MLDPENPSMEIAKAFAEGAGKRSANNVSEFIGGLFPFWGLKKKAIDGYVQEIQQSNLSPEAKMMAIANAKKTFRELKNQTAIIDVAYSALGEGQSIDADSMKKADGELISRLIDSGKFVSDEELQLLWGNVLAGELENPGTTPKNVVRILSELSKEYATAFATLCSLRVDIFADTGNNLVYCGQDMMVFLTSSYLSKMNINHSMIRELEQLGLINYIDIGHYSHTIHNKDCLYIHIVSNDHVITAINTKEGLPAGQVILTKAGQCISRFAPACYNRQHMEGIKDYLEKKANVKISPIPGIRITGIMGEGRYSYERQWTTPPQPLEQ